MIPIPLTYTVGSSDDQYVYTQIWRNPNYAIYEQRKHDEVLTFEVFKIRKQKDTIHFHTKEFIPAHELLPCNAMWGRGAYTVRSVKEAHEHIKYMIAKRKEIDKELSTIKDS